MSPSHRSQDQATVATDRPPFTATVSPTTRRLHVVGRRCGCDTCPAVSRTLLRPLTVQRTVSRLLRQTLWAAVAGAAYTCGATGTGTLLHWLIHR